MCIRDSYYVDIKSIAEKYNLQVSELYDLIKFKKDNLDDFIEDEILEFKQDIISVKESGRLFTRNIAMRFDPLIDQKIGSYSNTV